MIIIPAIDLLGGECVRLIKGDYGTSHKVAESAIKAAEGFKEAGCKYIHVVDLNGAVDKTVTNLPVIKEILSLGMDIELGGGIRNMNTVSSLAELGIKRIILGSAALKDQEFLKEALREYGEKIAVGIDAKNGFVSTEGWKETSEVHYLDFAKRVEDMGADNIIFTDISRDGTLSGPNYEMLRELKNAVSLKITASGGVKDLSHIGELKGMNLYGVIAGKALYSGTLNLKEAVNLLAKE